MLKPKGHLARKTQNNQFTYNQSVRKKSWPVPARVDEYGVDLFGILFWGSSPVAKNICNGNKKEKAVIGMIYDDFSHSSNFEGKSQMIDYKPSEGIIVISVVQIIAMGYLIIPIIISIVVFRWTTMENNQKVIIGSLLTFRQQVMRV